MRQIGGRNKLAFRYNLAIKAGIYLAMAFHKTAILKRIFEQGQLVSVAKNIRKLG